MYPLIQTTREALNDLLVVVKFDSSEQLPEINSAYMLGPSEEKLKPYVCVGIDEKGIGDIQ